MAKTIKKIPLREIKRAQEHRKLARYYNLNSILGNDWAMFYPIIGGRKTGKSYSVAEFIVKQKIKLKDGVKKREQQKKQAEPAAVPENEQKNRNPV